MLTLIRHRLAAWLYGRKPYPGQVIVDIILTYPDGATYRAAVSVRDNLGEDQHLRGVGFQVYHAARMLYHQRRWVNPEVFGGMPEVVNHDEP